MRRDAPEIACDLAELGLEIVVITNGALLTEATLDRFPADTLFEVTLLSAHARTHDELAGNRVFETILQNVVRIDGRGHRWAMACVVTHRNAREVAGAIELGVALGAQGLLLDRLNPNRRIVENAPHLLPTVDDVRSALSAAEDAAARYDLGVGVAVPVPPCLIEPADYPHLHFGWCPRGNSESYFTVDCRGRLRPCNHSSVVLGDLRAEPFLDLMQMEAANRLWAFEPDDCLGCQHPLRDRCRGGCPAAQMDTGLAGPSLGFGYTAGCPAPPSGKRRPGAAPNKLPVARPRRVRNGC